MLYANKEYLHTLTCVEKRKSTPIKSAKNSLCPEYVLFSRFVKKRKNDHPLPWNIWFRQVFYFRNNKTGKTTLTRWGLIWPIYRGLEIEFEKNFISKNLKWHSSQQSPRHIANCWQRAGDNQGLLRITLGSLANDCFDSTSNWVPANN